MDKAKAIVLVQRIAPMGTRLRWHIWAEEYIFIYSIYNEDKQNISHLVAEALQHELMTGGGDIYIEPCIAGTLQKLELAVRSNWMPQNIITALGRVIYNDVGAYDG